MADTSPDRGRWASRPAPREARSIVELIRAGMLDAELAATVWMLVDGRVPLLIAGDAHHGAPMALRESLLDLLPSDVRRVDLAGESETFDWLPQASELGWPGVAHAPATGSPIRAQDTVLVGDLSDGAPSSTWGAAARIAVRAAAIGYGLAVTAPGNSLDDLFAALRSMPIGLSDDELARVGVVLVLGRVGDGPARVVAAHYVRPVARDAHGHVQRLGPAVLAIWNQEEDRFEQFGWGVTPELAMRVGARPGDFELEVAARRKLLDDLAATGVVDRVEVRAAARRHRATSPAQPVASSAGPGITASH